MYMQIIYLIQNIVTGMHAQNSGLAGEQLSATCTRPREEDYALEDSGEEEEREHTCKYINNIVHMYRCAHIHTYIHTVLIHKFTAIASQERLNLLSSTSSQGTSGKQLQKYPHIQPATTSPIIAGTQM